MVAGSSGNLFSEMALAGMAGRAAGTTAGFARGNERIRADPRENRSPHSDHRASRYPKSPPSYGNSRRGRNRSLPNCTTAV